MSGLSGNSGSLYLGEQLWGWLLIQLSHWDVWSKQEYALPFLVNKGSWGVIAGWSFDSEQQNLSSPVVKSKPHVWGGLLLEKSENMFV